MAKAGSTASRLSPAREKLLLQESLLQARFIQTKIILQCRDAQALLAQPYIFFKKLFPITWIPAQCLLVARKIRHHQVMQKHIISGPQ